LKKQTGYAKITGHISFRSGEAAANNLEKKNEI
jgi:hypothetical protein